MVVPDVDRRPDRPVAERHDDRQTEAGRVVDRLGHEQQSLTGSCRVGARPCRRGPNGDGKRRELAFDIDELAIAESAQPHKFAQAFDDVGLRGDRIGADDLGPAEGDRSRHRLGAFDLFEHNALFF